MTDSPIPWFFVDDGRARGPVSRAELETLIEDEAVAADDLVWSPALEDWAPALEVEALGDVIPRTPPPLPDHVREREVSVEERVSAAHQAHTLKENDPSGPGPRPPAVPPSPETGTGTMPSTRADEAPEGPRRPAEGTEVAQDESLDPADEQADEDVHAWRRFFARHLDYLIWGLPGGALVGFALAGFSPALYQQSLGWSDQAWTFLAAAAWVPAESFLLTWFGWTPGKWLLSVEVRPKDGQQLRYGETLSRSADVFVRGVGLGLPLIALITQLVAANKLRKNGETSWDASHGFDVRCAELRAGRVLVAVVLTLGLVMAISLMSAA